ncbi:MAG TPA: hypothetical protein VFQ18_06725 [Candidatus Acidoferrum sp.]|nr:hypothetical protein [Candidatus Acidoferrum sp.]
MPTPIQIRTEADYLRAHVTVIRARYGGMNYAIHGIKLRFLALVKKWIWAAGAGKA